MKKLATKLTPAIKAWIKEEFWSDYYSNYNEIDLFHFPNVHNYNGFKLYEHIPLNLHTGYTEVSEQEFLAEFGKPKPIIQYLHYDEWSDFPNQNEVRIKPTPDYSKEIEALQNKAKENNQKVTIIFE